MEQTKQPSRRFSIEEKRGHVVAWRGSGLTRSEYVRQHQLAPSSFNKWCHRYGKAPSSKPAVSLKPMVVQTSQALSGVTPLGSIKLHIRERGCLEFPASLSAEAIIKITRGLLWN